MKRIDALKRALPAFGSRREFLTRLAEAGGYAAAFSSMHALGLMTATLAEGEELLDSQEPPVVRRGAHRISMDQA